MRQDAHDALPCLLLFFTKRAAEIGKDEELVRLAVAAERRSPQFEPAAIGAERPIDQSRRVPGEMPIQAQLAGAASEQMRRARAEQALGGGIGEHELLFHVEGEHRDVDGAHHARQQCRGLDRLRTLALQRVAQ